MDLPPLYNLAEDNASKFLDDYHSFDLSYATEVLNDPNTIVVDDSGFPVGVFWFNETLDDLHTQFHFLARPEYFRRILEQDICGKAADLTFARMKVGKMLAQAMHTQTSAIKLLRRYGFYEHKPWHKHTRQNGVKVDIINFELKRSFWEKKRGQR